MFGEPRVTKSMVIMAHLFEVGNIVDIFDVLCFAGNRLYLFVVLPTVLLLLWINFGILQSPLYQVVPVVWNL